MRSFSGSSCGCEATVAMVMLAAALVLVPARADAQGASKQAAAQALFDEAKKLMSNNELGDACKKFERSQELDPAPGTLFNLANCYEKSGLSASAWATFKSTAASYRALNRHDWEAKARERASALESKLSKLKIVLSKESAVQGLEVKRDGILVSSSELGTSIPVDPGEHVIEATAPGKKTWKAITKVAAETGEQTVEVGPLESASVVVAPPVSASTDRTMKTEPAKSGSSRKTLGFIGLGIGAVGLGVGAVTGVMALSKNNASTNTCPSDGACASADAVNANKSARTLGTISTIGFVAGGVCAAAGAILVITAPSAAPKTGSVRILPTAGAGGTGLAAVGVF